VSVNVDDQAFGVLIWGGVDANGMLLNDGVAIDRQTLRSRVLPQAPICPRRDFGYTFDGESLLIYGGVDAAGTPLNDGAAFSVTYGTWTAIPPGPLPPGPARMAGDLNDVFVVSRDPASGLGHLAILSRSNFEMRWEDVGEVPLPPRARYELFYCCEDTSSSATILSISDAGFAAAATYDNEYPHVGDWEQLGTFPLSAGPGPGPASGRTVTSLTLAWIREATSSMPESDVLGPYLVVAHPDERSTHVIGGAPAAAVGDAGLALTPDHVVSPAALVAYDFVEKRWESMSADLGRVDGPRTGAVSWWSHGQLYLWGGRAPDGSMGSEVFVFHPRLPAGVYALPGGYQSLSCGDVGYEAMEHIWTLRADREDPLLVWLESRGHRLPTQWPDGYTVRFKPDVLILAPSGKIAAREGDTWGRGTTNGRVYACLTDRAAYF
jgi:hypothetical protein